ncbi:Ubiquitin carboxyl-terminal hydrolase 10 [Tupaia chinensis]|uniref:Ubiquitin carboxyl-terminal hydrolase 10 n=1 Tax=Tupaia chinensis TaxID=246437 RepID=L9KP36_TUPCH|nr:Ubiquitin carboxyl-terminal hydrolase 10 [Tupaia chinensis]
MWYIFGDFSPDEFNQFFVTPRSSVELPPYSGTVLCGTQAADELPDGQDYQRIEFGVNEVTEPSGTAPRLSYSISSTLNPQAPEFILGCTAPKKTPDGIDRDANHSSVDGQYPDSALTLDGSPSVEVDVLENDGGSGGLGQRERKKKKKRPPGYYSYLKDGSDSAIPTEALVNGHTNSADPSSVGTDDAEFVGDVPSSVTPRTCNSPQNSTDFVRDTVPDGPFPGALDSVARTAGQPGGCHGTGFGHSCLPAEMGRGSLLRTAVAQPYVGTDTTENLGVANGQILESSGEGTAANGVELHTLESTDSDPRKAGSASPPADSAASAAGASPGSQPAKSWASLFHDSKPTSSSPVAYVETKYSPPATSPLVSEKQAEVKEGPVPVSEDPVAIKIAELLENVTLIHKPVSLQPRGLINKGNWCYINAEVPRARFFPLRFLTAHVQTLQALVACPPMYHLMKFIPLYSKVQRPCTSTPMIDSFVRLMNEFTNMPVPPKPRQGEYHVRLMNEFTNMPVPPKPRQALGDKTVRDIRPGAAFEPTYIYRLLTVIKSSLSEKGRQEDAEEYLGFILNGLHEEMLNLKKLLSPSNEKLPVSNGPKSHSVSEEEQEEQGAGSEEEWEQVGPRNKSSVTRQAEFVQTPITGIFGGHIRSVVYQQSSKESATLQPFFTLQLDIQSDKIRTVQDALESLVARESVQGYTTKTKQEVEISRRVTLEKLPPVLVLHLKRFVYEKTGGCQKLIKNIEYPVDLEISKGNPVARFRVCEKCCFIIPKLDQVEISRRVTLEKLPPVLVLHLKRFVYEKTGGCQKLIKNIEYPVDLEISKVVYHHGSSATGGHYTTDVFQIGLNGWLRIDDQTVRAVSQHQVVKPAAERAAYLLYYRRVNLL